MVITGFLSSFLIKFDLVFSTNPPCLIHVFLYYLFLTIWKGVRFMRRTDLQGGAVYAKSLPAGGVRFMRG